MSDHELHNPYSNDDPAPTYATDAEIRMAEELRLQIKQRYLAPITATKAVAAAATDDR